MMSSLVFLLWIAFEEEGQDRIVCTLAFSPNYRILYYLYPTNMKERETESPSCVCMYVGKFHNWVQLCSSFQPRMETQLYIEKKLKGEEMKKRERERIEHGPYINI